jgi:hypothetical protein
MLPTLPASPPRRPWHAPRRTRAAWLALACVLLAGGAPASAHALDLALGDPHARGGWVVVDARLDELFEDRVAQSLERGVPATIVVHAELWRRRGLWFDALEHTFDASVRVRYGAWDERYVVERRGAAALHFATLDSVADYLARPWSLPVGRLDALHGAARHYVAVTVTLKPLSAEDAREVEGWISGDPSDEGDGVTSLPRGLFDAVRNVSGFGDRRARATGSDFVPDTLAR